MIHVSSLSQITSRSSYAKIVRRDQTSWNEFLWNPETIIFMVEHDIKISPELGVQQRQNVVLGLKSLANSYLFINVKSDHRISLSYMNLILAVHTIMDDSSATAQLFLISSPTGWMIENNGMKVKLKWFQHISWKSISHCLSVNWYCFSHCLPLKQFLIFGLLLSFFKMDGFQASVKK